MLFKLQDFEELSDEKAFRCGSVARVVFGI